METPDPVKVKHYTRLALVFIFLLAFLWPIGGYFFWILGGASAYFFFLAWFHRPQLSVDFDPQQKDWKKEESRFSGMIDSLLAMSPGKLKLIGFIATMFIFLLVIANTFFGGSSSDSENKTNDLESLSEDDLTDRGNQYYNQAQYDSALFFYDKVLARDPENQYGLYNKGLVYYSKQDYQMSIKLLLQCVKAHPDYGHAYYLLGDDYLAMNREDSAVVCFEKAYKFEIRDAGMLQHMGDAYAKQGNTVNALKYYKEALGQDSTLTEVYRSLANIDHANAAWYQRQLEKREQEK